MQSRRERKRRTAAPATKRTKEQREKGGSEMGNSGLVQARKQVFASLKTIGPAYNARIAADTGLSLDIVEYVTLEFADNRLITNLVSERDFTRRLGPLWVVVSGDRQGTRPNDFMDVLEMSSDDILKALRTCLKGSPKLWIEWEALKRAVNVAESRLSSQMVRFQQHGDVTSLSIPGHGKDHMHQWLAIPRPDKPDILRTFADGSRGPLERDLTKAELEPHIMTARLSRKVISQVLATTPPGDVLTTGKVSEWFDIEGVTANTVERWRRRGDGPAYFLVKGPHGADSVRYDAGDVRDWLEEKRKAFS